MKSVIAILVLLTAALYSQSAEAMIPLYASDFQTQIFDWQHSEMLRPKTARLIAEQGDVFSEGTNLPGDAALFSTLSTPDVVHYLGFTNLWFGDTMQYMDPSGTVKSTEGNFYHSTDPATLTAWRTSSGVELRWTPDYRNVQQGSFSSLNASNPNGAAGVYYVKRTVADSSPAVVTFVPAYTNSFQDASADPSTAYDYEVLSICGGQLLPYSANPVRVGTSVSAVPNFWVDKADYQERLYQQEYVIGHHSLETYDPPVTWPFVFYADRPVNPSLATLEIYSSYDPAGGETVANVTGFAFDGATNRLSLNNSTTLKTILDHGGIAYRLKYEDGGTTVYYPREVSGRKHLICTSINNRVMGCHWLSYQMNIEGSDWLNYYEVTATRLRNGVNPTGYGSNVVHYDGLFMDSVSALNGTYHNTVRPVEYVNDETYRTATEMFIKQLCSVVPNMKFYANTDDRALLERLEGTSGFDGVMDESFLVKVNSPGWQELGDLIYLSRKYPSWRKLVMNAFDYAYYTFEREQGIVGYLCARNPDDADANKLLYGYGDWNPRPGSVAPAPDVNIMPEQCIQFGDAVSDPFRSTPWPSAAAWTTARSNQANLISWLSTNAPGFVVTSGTESFAVRIYELIDGLPETANYAIGVWHLGPATSGPVSLAAADLPLEQTGSGGLYRLDLGNSGGQGLDVNATRLVDGGTFGTVPVNDIVMQADRVALLFTAPIHSPTVAGAAVAKIPAGQPRTAVLQIAASHWNGKELSVLRVDGRDGNGVDMGWGDAVDLHDADHDGIYTANVTNGPGVTPGLHTLHAVAIGNDGLRTYADVVVEAETVPDIAIATEAAYPVLAKSHDGKVVLSVKVTSYVPLSSTSPVEATAPAIFGNSTPVTLWDDGQAGNRLGAEDAVAGDGIFTSDRVTGSVNATGILAANVAVHPVTGAAVTGTVAVTAIRNRAEFSDASVASGALQDNAIVLRYAMAYGNTNADHVTGRKIMIVTFADDATYPMILENQSHDGSAAEFVRQEDAWLDASVPHLPPSSRGVCFGDFGRFDGGAADGKEDFFLCSASGSHLYVNDGTPQAPRFVDVTNDAFPVETDRNYLVGAMSASWSDFDLDGDLDLYVGTSNYTGPMSEIGNHPGVTFAGVFFENDGNGVFHARGPGAPSSTSAVMTGAWAKLSPAKKWPYMVMPWISGSTMVAYQFDTGYPVKQIPVAGGQLSNLTSIAVCDYNHDGLPDLLVTMRDGGGKAVVLRNDYTIANGLALSVACTLGEGRIWSGATVGDFDGNGQDDILLLPESGPPALYMARGYSVTPQYDDLAFTLGLRDGATSGCVATDMGGTRLPDIAFGRRGTRVMYQNMGTISGPEPRRWVDLNLSSVGNSNSSLVGTEVTIQQSGRSWTKIVDGGSGRGGQDANAFRFFLDEDASNVAVNVNYPSGDSDFLASVPVDSVYAVVEDTPVTLRAGTKTNPDPTFSYELGPGTMDWVFRWRTVGIKGDQRQDAVTVENYAGYTDTSPCYMGIEPGTPRVLHWGDPGVTFRIYWDGTDWVHEARWAGLPCASGCQYRFKVTSGIGNGVTTTSTQAKVIPALEFCMPDPDPNQQ